MAKWQNDKMAKWQNDEMAIWRNGTKDKDQSYKIKSLQ